jgi:hypothetical protein
LLPASAGQLQQQLAREAQAEERARSERAQRRDRRRLALAGEAAADPLQAQQQQQQAQEQRARGSGLPRSPPTNSNVIGVKHRSASEIGEVVWWLSQSQCRPTQRRITAKHIRSKQPSIQGSWTTTTF